MRKTDCVVLILFAGIAPSCSWWSRGTTRSRTTPSPTPATATPDALWGATDRCAPITRRYPESSRTLQGCDAPSSNDWQLLSFWYFLSDGVGLIQQSGLCRPHLPQHERVGFSVETGDVLSLQLLAKVSVRGWLTTELTSKTLRVRRGPNCSGWCGSGARRWGVCEKLWSKLQIKKTSKALRRRR